MSWGSAKKLLEAKWDSSAEHHSTDMAYQRGKRVVEEWTRISSWARDEMDHDVHQAERLADMVGGVIDAIQEQHGGLEHFDPDVDRRYERERRKGHVDRAGEPISMEGLLLKATLESWAADTGALGKLPSAEFSKLVKICVKTLEAL